MKRKYVNILVSSVVILLVFIHILFFLRVNNTPFSDYFQKLSIQMLSIIGFCSFLLFIILGVLFFYIHMNGKKRIEKEDTYRGIIDSFGSVYDNVAVMNYETNTVVFHKMGEKIAEYYGTDRLAGNYEDITKDYIRDHVYIEDKELFEKKSSLENIHQELEFNKEYSFGYRTKIDNEIHYFQMQYLRANEYSKDVVIAIKNIDSIIEKEKSEHERLNNMIEMQATQLSILSSISGIYLTAHMMDLSKNVVIEINTSKQISDLAVGTLSPAEQMELLIKHTITPEYLENALAFTNLNTVAKRLTGKKSISEEMIGRFHGWIRASFNTVECDENGVPQKIMFTTQVIDNEKRRVEKLVETANSDELTGLHNRHAYEDELRELKNNPPADNFVYISMDVNGLKTANDNLGHVAGDELLCGAAECIQKCFGKYGHTYRTGGDEFQAMIYVDSDKLEILKQQFEQETEKWAGKYVSELRVSAGYVSMDEVENASISEIAKLADQKMYKAKSAFYSSRGLDRRGQQVAYEVLCQSYAKILKVDLTTDTYTVIQQRKDKYENDPYSESDASFSESTNFYVESGRIYEGDVEIFQESTNLEKIRSIFAHGSQLYSIRYRRKVDGIFMNVLMEMIPAKDYTNESQKVYLYVKVIDC